MSDNFNQALEIYQQNQMARECDLEEEVCPKCENETELYINVSELNDELELITDQGTRNDLILAFVRTMKWIEETGKLMGTIPCTECCG